MAYGTRYDPAPPDLLATGYQDWSAPALDDLVYEVGLCARRKPPVAGRDRFYPEPGETCTGPEREAQAREVCRGCTIAMGCLERTMRTEAAAKACFGISGGVSEKRRRVILRGTEWVWPRPGTVATPAEHAPATEDDEDATQAA